MSFNKSVYLYITLGGLKTNARTEMIEACLAGVDADMATMDGPSA